MIYDVIIIGGGASGLYAASQFKNKLNGLILEKSSKPALKLMMSGAGQCNFTHDGNIKDFLAHYGSHSKEVRSCLYKHNNMAVMDFFEVHGVPYIIREDGKVFPKSLQSASVKDCLLQLSEENGFSLMCNSDVTNIEIVSSTNDRVDECASNYTYIVHCGNKTFSCHTLIIATGGCSYPTTGSDGSMFEILKRLGIKIETPIPALVPVFVQEYPYSELSGISFDNIELTISKNNNKTDKVNDILKFSGDLLFTYDNFSGPIILNNSRDITTGDKISFNYFPGYTPKSMEKLLKEKASGNKKQLAGFISETAKSLDIDFPKRFAELITLQILNAFDISQDDKDNNHSKDHKVASLPGKVFTALASRLTEDTFSVSGLGSFKNAMVTKGGVNLNEIDMKTMEAINYKGLYIIGEALDIDGDTGGYNLQFAFSSAVCAAQAAGL